MLNNNLKHSVLNHCYVGFAILPSCGGGFMGFLELLDVGEVMLFISNESLKPRVLNYF
jgi:hypothetical protein